MLHLAIINNDIETAQCIIDHGAAFDSGYNFQDNKYQYSIECYFDNYVERSGLEDLKHTDYECVKFMIDNNAKMVYDDNSYNILFCAVENICCDGNVSDDDVRIVKLIKDSGVNINDTNSSGETPFDVFVIYANYYKIPKEEKERITDLIESNEF